MAFLKQMILSGRYARTLVVAIYGLFLICGIPLLATGQTLTYHIASPLKTQAVFTRGSDDAAVLKIAYLPPAAEFNFYLDVWKGISMAAEATGSKAFMLAPQKDNPPEQMKMLSSVLEQGVSAIILSTHDESAAAPLIRQALDQGIIVIIVNSDTLTYSAPVHAVVGYVQRKGTYRLGQYALELSRGNAMEIGILEGEPGYHSTERVGGFEDAIKGSKLQITARMNGHWNTQGGYNAALQMFDAHPDIKMVFAANDFEIIGAAAALKNMGLSRILLFGNDGDPVALSAIAEGTITATVYTNPVLMGRVAMQVVLDSVDGEFKGGFVEIPTVLITPANVRDYLIEMESETLRVPLTEITAVSETLPGLTNEDGTGLYWDLLRAIYEPQGIQVNIKIVPLKRARFLVEHQNADVMLGHYHGDSKGTIFPQWHYSAQDISAIFKKDHLKWTGRQSLAGKKVAWIRGADYDKYLAVPVNSWEASDHIGPLLMLEANRIDVFLDAHSELLKTFQRSADRLEKAGFELSNYQIETVLKLNLYPGFADTAQGRRLSNIFDAQMPKLLSSGRLKALFEHWGFKSFPF